MPPNSMPPGMPQGSYQMPHPGMHGMPKKKSHFDFLIIPLVIVSLLFISALVFALWAYAGMSEYKTESDKKSAAAVSAATKELTEQKDKEFAEKEKLPYVTYTGPSEYGSVKVTYPKTWSAYVEDEGDGTIPLNAYFHKDYVPSLDGATGKALRIEIVKSSYDDEIKKLDSKVKSGKLKLSPFKLDKVPTAVGSRVDGEISNDRKGSMVLLPLRATTLKIYTEADQVFMEDFNKIILANLSFIP